MEIEISHNEFYTAQIPLFGKWFPFQFSKKPSKKQIEKNIHLYVSHILKYIVEVQSEWGRRDDKKVVLFYRKTSSHLIGFVFAVEADETLTELMKERQDNFSKIVEYVGNNYKNLNFNV